jgi:hypothetical protein
VRAGNPRAGRKLEWCIFVALFGTYAYFFQGGGWNANGRFAQVRAIVETGALSINDYVHYEADLGGGRRRLVRRPVPLLDAWPKDRSLLNSWDVTLHEGRLYPNKPPGSVFLALPGYVVADSLADVAGLPADDAWGLTVRAWLTNVLSVALAGAGAGVALLRAGRRLWPDLAERDRALAAATLGLGTLMLPFSTILMDHVWTAALLLGAFVLLLGARDGERADSPARLAGAGALAGGALLCNYTAALGLGILGLYAAWRVRAVAPLAAFAAGAALPLAVLAGYHAACFGGPLVTANHGQPPGRFVSEGLWLGMIGTPDPRVLVQILVSPFRGLFFSSPVLLLGAVGLAWAALAGRRAEAAVAVAVFAAMVLLNAGFNGWDAGNSFGPRYLIPAVPFLALGLPGAFARLPRLTRAAALASVAVMLFATFVTPRSPREARNPYTDFLGPIAVGAVVERGPVRFLGPVSASPAGVYGGRAQRAFGRTSPEARWSSFNVGEFLWPGSWWSALPLLAFLGAAALLGGRLTRRAPA